MAQSSITLYCHAQQDHQHQGSAEKKHSYGFDEFLVRDFKVRLFIHVVIVEFK